MHSHIIWLWFLPRHTYLCQNDRCVVGKETAIWAHLYIVNTVLYTSERITVLDSASVGFSNNYLLTKDQMCSAYREFSRPLLADTRSGAWKTVNFWTHIPTNLPANRPEVSTGSLERAKKRSEVDGGKNKSLPEHSLRNQHGMTQMG